MLSAEPMALPPAALAEAKTYLRIQGSDEDGLIGELLASAAGLCEQFSGQALLTRAFTETVAPSPVWKRLTASPVRSISALEALATGGAAAPLGGGDYSIDIDASGDGWVRILNPGGAARMRVSYEAGLAAEWDGLPEALRQGVVRLAAHFYVERDRVASGEPPAAVAALWRPFRRLRLA
jgi:uncharacterized phiE125 gp8 family phage protein